MSLPLMVAPLPSAPLSSISCFSVAASLVVYSLRQVGTSRFAELRKKQHGHEIRDQVLVMSTVLTGMRTNLDDTDTLLKCAPFQQLRNFIYCLHNQTVRQVLLYALQTSEERRTINGTRPAPEVHLSFEAICCCAATGTDDILCTQARSSETEARHLPATEVARLMRQPFAPVCNDLKCNSSSRPSHWTSRELFTQKDEGDKKDTVQRRA